MHVNLPDPSQFNYKDVTIAGDECVLITPKEMGVKWTEENKYFRSSIWRKKDNFPISLSWRKFTNHGEQPDFEPIDGFDDLEYILKLDGSALIISKTKNQLIVRTRGTVDASLLPNGHEISFLKQKYPKVFDNELLNTEMYSFLYEWTTPTNRIVLQESDEPTLWLTGIVRHEDYSYVSQKQLDEIAENLFTPRPKRYSLSLKDINKWLDTQVSIEGVVTYANNGQYLKKFKTQTYLVRHKLYTGIKNVNHIIDLWIQVGELNRKDFEDYLQTTYDWELVKILQPLICEMYAQWSGIQLVLKSLRTILENTENLTRKEIAKKVLDKAGVWSSICFEILDGKKHNPKKLFELYSLGKHPHEFHQLLQSYDSEN